MNQDDISNSGSGKEEPKPDIENISEKEFGRDMINLHLSEPDFIGNGDFDAIRKEMIERYGEDFYDDEDTDQEEE